MLLRNSQQVTVSVVLADREDANTVFGEKNKPGKGGKQGDLTETYNFLGTEFTTPSSKDFKKNGVYFGVMVKSVDKKSFFLGVLRPGEIVVGINKQKIQDLDDLKSFGEKNKDKKSFLLQVVNNGLLFYRGVEK